MALAEVFERVAGPGTPLEFQAYDGSTAGERGNGIRVVIRSPAAVSYLAQAPGELGLARAYVAGHLDVHGDMYTALTRMAQAQSGTFAWPQRRWLSGRRHSRQRDAGVIAHHYDVSNRFYELVLGPSMAYTCACYPHPGASLEQAQAHKFDLVARKLGLRAGMRLLDVGCGWV